MSKTKDIQQFFIKCNKRDDINVNGLASATYLQLLVMAVYIINNLIWQQTPYLLNANRPLRWRSSQNREDETQRLVRYDLRNPNIIFEHGFRTYQVLNITSYNWNIYRYAQGRYERPITPFISTSRNIRNSDGTWQQWMPNPAHGPLRDGSIVYVYEIFAVGGIDINATLGPGTLSPEQNEIVFAGGIRREFIRSAIEMEVINNRTGYRVLRLFQNPRFRYVPELNLTPISIPKEAQIILWNPNDAT